LKENASGNTKKTRKEERRERGRIPVDRPYGGCEPFAREITTGSKLRLWGPCGGRTSCCWPGEERPGKREGGKESKKNGSLFPTQARIGYRKKRYECDSGKGQGVILDLER